MAFPRRTAQSSLLLLIVRSITIQRTLKGTSGSLVISATLLALTASAGMATVTPAGMSALGNATQAIIVEAPSTASTRATVRLFAFNAGNWKAIRAGMPARVGYGGMSQPTRRHEGDGTTPMGIYSLVYGFGSRPDPGITGFKWRRTNPLACWSSTRSAYNRWVGRKPCLAPDENLWANRNLAYRYAAVLDFNYAHPVFGRGSGIFLHVMRPGSPTSGCVSLAERDLVALLRWARPGVRVVIGTTATLAALKTQ